MLEILLIIFYALLAFGVLDYYRKSASIALSRKLFSAFYLLKLAMAFGLIALYTYYYTDRATSDIYKFFDDSLVIHQIASTDFAVYLKLLFGFSLNTEEHRLILETQHWDASAIWGGTGNRMMTRVHLLIHWFSFSNIWVHSIVFNALSVLGFLWIYRALSPYFNQPLLILPAFLMPSVLFWSSGMLKEALLIFFTGMLFNALHLYAQKKYKWAVLFSVISFLAIFFLKIYLLMALFPLILVCLLKKAPLFNRANTLLNLVFGLTASILILHAVSLVIFEKSLIDLLMLRYNEFLELALAENAGSLLSTQVAKPEKFWEWFFNAFKHTWLMPWPWQEGGLLIKMAGFEHLLFYLMALSSLFFLLRMQFKIYNAFPFFAFLIYSVLLFQLIGLTVPVLGAIVRYKMPALLFSVLFFAFIWDNFRNYQQRNFGKK